MSQVSAGRGRKINKKSGIKADKKAQRKADAEDRQKKYDSLSLMEKIAQAGTKVKAKLAARSQK